MFPKNSKPTLVNLWNLNFCCENEMQEAFIRDEHLKECGHELEHFWYLSQKKFFFAILTTLIFMHQSVRKLKPHENNGSTFARIIFLGPEGNN